MKQKTCNFVEENTFISFGCFLYINLKKNQEKKCYLINQNKRTQIVSPGTVGLKRAANRKNQMVYLYICEYILYI